MGGLRYTDPVLSDCQSTALTTLRRLICLPPPPNERSIGACQTADCKPFQTLQETRRERCSAMGGWWVGWGWGGRLVLAGAGFSMRTHTQLLCPRVSSGCPFDPCARRWWSGWGGGGVGGGVWGRPCWLQVEENALAFRCCWGWGGGGGNNCRTGVITDRER